MNLSNIQRRFINDEFGLSEAQFYGLSPLPLWKLREDCIDIECCEAMLDTNAATERGNVAASVVDILSSILPKEWKQKTPPEVEALYPGIMASKGIEFFDGLAVAV
ncbi:MAG: hypothetical protein FWB88_03785 [Defluviitaleaceae bacterium]|nr:hypothetical protein [Defluviitaleaceae bacterium]MCL2239061.1 hypothetical protein [Defluviitaleaceae bacterium]